jgi:hypothetical protein
MEGPRPFARVFALVFALLALAGGGFIAYQFFLWPRVTEALPARVRPGDSLTLRGERLGTDTGTTFVLFGDRSGRVKTATGNELKVDVPDLPVNPGQEVRVPVRVLVDDRAAAIQVVVYQPAIVATTETVVLPGVSPSPAAPSSTAPSAPAVPPAMPKPEASPAPTPSSAAGPPAKAASPAASPRPRRTPAASPRPRPSPETSPHPTSPAPPLPRPRAFVAGETVVESRKAVSNDLRGFDASGVEVKRAPDIPGRIEFEVIPANVKAGEPYTVNVFLSNHGTKAIKVDAVTVVSTLNDTRSRGTLKPKAKDVPPQERTLVAELPGIWREDVSAWAMEVTISSAKGDTYRSRLAWK